jgi:N-acetyl-gamma-glutamyl-phosphate reductase
MTQQEVLETLQEFYARRQFIRVSEHLPSTKHTMGTNFCDISARIVGDYVITISCIDNLIKGASGAAVQNMNLMFGFSEKTALM